jgi:mRNA interferase YafQ
MREPVQNKRFDAQLQIALRGGLDFNDWGDLVYRLLKYDRLPPEYHEHRLTDNWTGHWECHLSGDLVVVYKRKSTKIIFVTIGTHQELFHSRRRKTKGRKPPPADLEEVIERALDKAAREIKRWWSARR